MVGWLLRYLVTSFSMSHTKDYHQRSLGLTFTPDHTAQITVWAPFAQKVAVSIQAGSSELPLQKGTNGDWHGETDQIKPGDLYTFVINDEQECADPASLIQPQGFYGPSQAFDTSAFYWEDAHWVNPPIDDYIIYELDICTFTPEGTLKALIHKLSHLKKLGVTAILLRPITPFLNPQSQQQSAPFLYAVQTSCGGPAHLQQLVNACHFEGIAVILDLVYQRTEQPAKGFGNFGLLARSQARTLTDKPDFFREAHERYLIENMMMWFQEFHIDAIQLRDIQTLPDADQLLHRMRERTNALTNLTGRQYYLLAEHDLPQPMCSNEDKSRSDRVRKPISSGNRADSARNSFNQDVIARRCQTRHYQESYLYDAHFSEVLGELFDREGAEGAGEGVLSLSQTCYKTQNNLLETYTTQPLTTESVKLMAGYILVSPCIPTLFMGEEWGHMNPFLALTQDEPVRMAEKSLPVDQEIQSASASAWEGLDEPPSPTLYRYYQSLTALRRQQPALYHLNPRHTRIIHQEGEPTLLMHRWHKTNDVLCLMNFSSEKQIVTLPDLGENWQKLLDSADPVWEGPGASPELLASKATLMLQPESIVVYKAQA